MEAVETHVEHKDTPEDTAYGLGNVATRILGLRCGDGHKLHALEGEGSLYKCRHDGEEAVSSNVADESSTRERAGCVPVTESKAIMVGTTSKVNH